MSKKHKQIQLLSVKKLSKYNNHEIWRECPKCGTHNDLRKTDYCEECYTYLK